MSSEASKIFVGALFLILLYARWGHDRRFPAGRVTLALVAIAIGLGITYGFIDVSHLAPNLAKFWQLAGEP